MSVNPLAKFYTEDYLRHMFAEWREMTSKELAVVVGELVDIKNLKNTHPTNVKIVNELIRVAQKIRREKTGVLRKTLLSSS